MSQQELFGNENLYLRLDKNKDPLVELNKIIDWNIFVPPLKAFFAAIPHKSDVGPKIGQKTSERRLYNKVKHLKNCMFYTDNWSAFSEVLPPERHIIGKIHEAH